MPHEARELGLQPCGQRSDGVYHVGPKGWVGVVLDTKPDWKLVRQLVRDGYVFVATAKLRKLLSLPKPP